MLSKHKQEEKYTASTLAPQKECLIVDSIVLPDDTFVTVQTSLNTHRFNVVVHEEKEHRVIFSTRFLITLISLHDKNFFMVIRMKGIESRIRRLFVFDRQKPGHEGRRPNV